MSEKTTVNGYIAWIVRGLIGAAVVSGISMAIAQAQLDTRVDTAEKILEDNQPIINSVDVIQARVKRIEEDVTKLDKKLDRNHSEVMQAIRASK